MCNLQYRYSLEEKKELLEYQIKALDLLEKVYNEIGPYNDGKISNLTLNRLNVFFNFNDGE